MPGEVTQFPNFAQNTAGDDGENNSASVLPNANGEALNATVLGRPIECLRQRFEVLRSIEEDSLYLRDAQQNLIVAGPGTVTWPGSTTASFSGIPTLSDVLFIVPGLTPGAAQTSPIPPVASAYGSLFLLRASDSHPTLQVQSLRRSYAGGDQINVTVVSGGSFSCVLSTEATFERTITLTVTGSTTMSTVLSALNALTPSSPDNTQLVTATLVDGGLGTDIILSPQTVQFVAGNYDGEGHTLSPANLAGFFSSNPAQALAEGDSLCVQYADVTNLSSLGGRRQSIPENSNTLISASSLFNSRLHPELIVNSLFICKVVNGNLVFGTGAEVAQGATDQPLGAYTAANISYAGGPNWADGTTNPATTVQAQLSKIVSDLAGSGAGAAKIEGPTVGTYLTAGPLGGQIATIANFVHSDKAPAETSYVPLRTYNDYLGNVRSLIDHTGYRMGQVSEIDENWVGAATGEQLVHLDPLDGVGVAGSPTTAGSVVQLNTSSDVWALGLSEAIPSGAVINSIVIYYFSGNTANGLTATLNSTALSGSGTTSSVVSKTITTAVASTVETLTLFVSPTSGHLPHQSLTTEKLSLALSCTISASDISLLDVQISYTAPPNGWTYTQGQMNLASNSDQLTFNLPASGLSQRTVMLQTLGTGSGNGISSLTGPAEAWADANLSYTMEFLVKTGTVDDSNHEFSTDLGVKIGSDAITMHWDFSYGSWQLNFNADSQTFTSTGVPVVANTLYLVRLEICGPNMNSAGGSNYRARLFINGALVANVAQAGTSITGNTVNPWFNTQTNSTSGGPYNLSIGRVRRTWNHFQTGYAL
jgi:hypothetical protein